MTRPAPPLALFVEMPDAGHVQMGAERKAPLNHDLEELADRLDRSHRVADPQPVHASARMLTAVNDSPSSAGRRVRAVL